MRIDAGAAHGLSAECASLSPKGVIAAEGEFRRGDMVEIISADDMRCIAHGITQYSVAEIRLIHGYHTRDIEGRLGYSYGDAVVQRDDLAMLDTPPTTGLEAHA